MSEHRGRSESSERSKPSRRGFLAGSAAVAGGVVLGGGLASGPAQAAGRTRMRVAAAVQGVPTLGVSELPAWYEENRVQGHTVLQPGFAAQYLDTPEWEQAPGAFKDMGANVFTRHLIAAWEDPWWPSDAPRGLDGERLFDDDRINANTTFVEAGRNIAAEMAQQAQDAGTDQIVYFRHETDRTSEELHPEWICRDPDGNPLSSPRGIWLDVTSPYRDVVLTRFLELAESGIQGVYLDAQHLPAEACWGSSFQEKYELETGQQAPTEVDVMAPEFQDWLDFRAKEQVQIIQYWQDEVHAEYPDFVFIVSGPQSQALLGRGESTDLARVADSIKTEYHHASLPLFNLSFFENNPDFAVPEHDIRQALGWSLLLETSEGRPPNIWAAPRAPNADYILGFVSAVTTYGAVAAVDVKDENILEETHPENARGAFTLREDNIAGYELGNRVSPFLAYTSPARWAAVHFSEQQRNTRLPDQRAAWREVLWPVTGAFGVLARERVPANVITDRHLEEGDLDGFELLVLTHRDELSAPQEATVADFEASGGTVIEIDEALLWHDPDETEDAAAAFHATIAPYLADARVHVTGGPERLHAVGHAANETGELSVIAVANDFTFADIRARFPEPEDVNPTPPPADGVQVAWRSNETEPQMVFEAVSEQWLTAEPTNTGYTVALPEFQHMALLVLDPDTSPEVSFGDAVTVVNEFYDAGALNRSQKARLLVHLSIAERLADQGLIVQAQQALDRFIDVASDVDDQNARAELTTVAETLKTQL